MSFLNTLTHLEPGEGYFIRMKQEADLRVVGRRLATDAPLHLAAGWRWIAYLPAASRSLPEALVSLEGKCDYLLGETGTYSPYAPAFLNTLREMQPGGGYLVRIRQEATLVYVPGG